MQDEDDREGFGTCLACGAIIESTMARSYLFGQGDELCSACAATRGGVYVVDRDVWDPPPDLSGLPVDDPGGDRRRRRG
jgi:hypothetical protein